MHTRRILRSETRASTHWLVRVALLLSIVLTVGCGGPSGSAASNSPSQKPNMVLVLTGDLTVGGDVAGRLTLSRDSVCQRLPPPDDASYELDFNGTLAGQAWTLVVQGSAATPGTYTNLDAGLGQGRGAAAIYVSHGDQSSITFGPDLNAGTLDLKLRTEDGRRGVTVTGTFRCSPTAT